MDISVLEFMPLEAISFYLKEESFQFHKVSSPFTSYLGPDSLQYNNRVAVWIGLEGIDALLSTCLYIPDCILFCVELQYLH